MSTIAGTVSSFYASDGVCEHDSLSYEPSVEFSPNVQLWCKWGLIRTDQRAKG